MPLLFFQGTSRIYLIIYQVLGNSLHCQETDDLHNFQYHRLEFLHIHCHYHNHLGLFHIYALLCSNSKNSDILKLIIVTCNRGDTILCTRWAPANKRKLISSTSRKFSMSCQVSQDEIILFINSLLYCYQIYIIVMNIIKSSRLLLQTCN